MDDAVPIVALAVAGASGVTWAASQLWFGALGEMVAGLGIVFGLIVTVALIAQERAARPTEVDD
ncbi:uncharacterized protein NP_7070A (plasmid) [Natronomonas pharaonis DSM 2160]|uniref:Uncharacterized protein n=1 Tax=Natronomonas pharaonis (strain ATCC 35678 / DSM 2160 / CIP 103997 / JCM 8858 / NBRC 14720 / NCIMB 2260 / Gabara) TaxID=348780 RepID=Q3ILS0_NATPD|nr:hypothetical protein [Natronomonas pharaonis]CAI49714.2 uncharacterized protein NP_3246A [Natronomonas pharaonis DSM 2160]CAI50951.2 uncharacterized protein NP_7070A [Natronomonas pharaonis DSM 2160]